MAKRSPPATLSLDCRSMMCPLPIIELAKAARGLGQGDVVEIVGSDPALPSDLAAWVLSNGHELLEMDDTGPEFIGRVLISRDSR